MKVKSFLNQNEVSSMVLECFFLEFHLAESNELTWVNSIRIEKELKGKLRPLINEVDMSKRLISNRSVSPYRELK